MLRLNGQRACLKTISISIHKYCIFCHSYLFIASTIHSLSLYFDQCCCRSRADFSNTGHKVHTHIHTCMFLDTGWHPWKKPTWTQEEHEKWDCNLRTSELWGSNFTHCTINCLSLVAGKWWHSADHFPLAHIQPWNNGNAFGKLALKGNCTTFRKPYFQHNSQLGHICLRNIFYLECI